MASYVLFDTETTGIGENDRIIQIGAMIVKGRENIKVYDEFCSTSVPISIEAMEIHNITPNDIASLAPFEDTMAWQAIQELNSKENYLIAHNVSFDLKMLQREGFSNSYTLIDTLRCTKHLLPDSKAHRLQYLRYSLDIYKDEKKEADRLGITIKAHDAIGDVLIMKLLLSKLVKLVKDKFPDDKPMEKLADLTQTPVLLTEFKFGKYKDQNIKDIAMQDSGYLKWMRKNLDLDEDLTYTLDYYLEQF